MDLFLLWIQLAGAAGIILASAQFLAKSSDVIAFKTGLGRSFAGVVLLATATSLPELGTGVSAITLFDEPDLAAGDAFGSNLFNLMIIGLLDVYWRDGLILKNVTPTSVLVGALGIAIIALAAMAIFIHGATTAAAGWFISPVSVVMIIVFVAAMYMIYRASRAQEKGDATSEHHEYAEEKLPTAILTYLVAALIIIASAIWLASAGDRLATEMGWEASFVGTQFLAISTSLPELAASFAALRINAPELAITNVLGSNLFNMGFVLFLDDVAFTDGALWAVVSDIHILTAAIAILMTSVVLVAMAGHARGRPGRFWTPEAVLLIGMYVSASVLVFYLG